MLTYNPSYGTSYVHVESGSGGMAVSVVARLLQLPHFFFHFVEMLLLQDLTVKSETERDNEKFPNGFRRLFYF